MRDQAHENAYAKALESLGVNWGATLPIPKTDAERFPEVKKLLDQGLHLKQYTFSADNLSEAGKVYRGTAPAIDGRRRADHEPTPEGFPMDIAVERPEEFGPGLDPSCSRWSRPPPSWSCRRRRPVGGREEEVTVGRVRPSPVVPGSSWCHPGAHAPR